MFKKLAMRNYIYQIILIINMTLLKIIIDYDFSALKKY